MHVVWRVFWLAAGHDQVLLPLMLTVFSFKVSECFQQH
jgi:hypothetical protein